MSTNHLGNSAVSKAVDLPKSVEESYRKKCIDLKARIRELEASNNARVVTIEKKRRAVHRARMLRAILTDYLENITPARMDDSDGSPSPPPTPQPREKPLRIKQSRPLNNHSNSSSTPKRRSGNPGKMTGDRLQDLLNKNKIARPRSAFQIFSDERVHIFLARLHKDHEDYRPLPEGFEDVVITPWPVEEGEDPKTADIYKLVAAEWRNLPQAEKDRYAELSRIEVEDFKAEKKAEEEKKAAAKEARVKEEQIKEEN